MTLRYIAGYAAIAAAIPYLVLKVIWLAGGTVGTNTTTPEGAGIDALNAATFVMDAIAIAVALALTHDFGMRLPAPLVLFPMWVATGFLAPIAIAVPATLAIVAVQGGQLFPASGSLVQPWVYGFVYTGFIIQGVGLTIAFVMYTRRRWPVLPDGPADGPASSLHRLIATVTAVLSFLIFAGYLLWAAEGPLPGNVLDVIFALMSLVGGIGVVMLIRNRRRPPAVALAWLGAGTNFSWGLWFTVNALMVLPLTPDGDYQAERAVALGLVNLLRVLVGVMIGMLAAFNLSEAAEKVPG